MSSCGVYSITQRSGIHNLFTSGLPHLPPLPLLAHRTTLNVAHGSDLYLFHHDCVIVFLIILNFRMNFEDFFIVGAKKNCELEFFCVYLPLDRGKWLIKKTIEEVWKQKPRQTVIVLYWGARSNAAL